MSKTTITASAAPDLMRACVCTTMCVCAHLRVCVSVHKHVSKVACVYVCSRICACMQSHVCGHMSAWVRSHVCVSSHMSACVWLHVCAHAVTCVCMWVCMSLPAVKVILWFKQLTLLVQPSAALDHHVFAAELPVLSKWYPLCPWFKTGRSFRWTLGPTRSPGCQTL